MSQLAKFQYELESTKAKLGKEQKERGERYKKNVDFLKKYMDDANN